MLMKADRAALQENEEFEMGKNMSSQEQEVLENLHEMEEVEALCRGEDNGIKRTTKPRILTWGREKVAEPMTAEARRASVLVGAFGVAFTRAWEVGKVSSVERDICETGQTETYVLIE